MTLSLDDILIALSFFGGLALALETGFRYGRRTATGADDRSGGQVGSIQGSILGLLGLLLAFSFGSAASRFIDRQDRIVDEANAIGTAYLRADLLDEPERTRLREALQRYTEHRIEISKNLRHGLTASMGEEVARMHAEIWASVRAGVAARPATIVAVTAPVNELIDLHATRVALADRRLPPLVLGLLLGSSLLAVGIMGYACGMGGQRRTPLTYALSVLIAATLWVTIDLDRPRAGLMQVSDTPFEAIVFDPERE